MASPLVFCCICKTFVNAVGKSDLISYITTLGSNHNYTSQRIYNDRDHLQVKQQSCQPVLMFFSDPEPMRCQIPISTVNGKSDGLA